MRKIVVRTPDCMVFEIDPKTREAKHTARYDAYCFSDPEENVEYVEFSNWLIDQSIEETIKSEGVYYTW